MSFQRISIMLAMILVAALLALQKQARITSAKNALSAMESELGMLKSQRAALETAIASRQSQVQAQTGARNIAQSALATEQRKLAKADPNNFWAEPPVQLPDWNQDSPFVWLSKEMLSRLPVTPFSASGELDPQLASVLTLTEPQRIQLNAKLLTLLEEYRGLEAAHVEFSTNHPSGIKHFPGEKLTIIVPPLQEDGERLKNEFIGSIKAHLGEQRSELILRQARGWLGEHFNHEATRPKMISAVRHANGTFNISIQTGGSSMSVGDQVDFDTYIPSHLRPFFLSWQKPTNAF
jgi:hypothetical protein